MTRRKRTEILIRGRKEILQQLVKDIESKYEVKILQEPQNGLIMIKMRENAKAGLFYLGEVLVTEVKVMLQLSIGTGIIRGHDAESAIMLAIIDAAYNAELPEISEWEEILLAEELLVQENQMAEYNAILRTKVDFESMNLDV